MTCPRVKINIAILTMAFILQTLVAFYPASAASEVIPGAKTYSYQSSTSGRTYKIFTVAPNAPAPAGGYPVIYLTDANAYIGTMTETMRHYVRGGKGRQEAVIVGIGYPAGENIGTARAVDLTQKLGSQGTPDGFGGATMFLRFILDELKPHIEDSFPINKEKQTLFGHSFGGLFTLQTLINEPSAFQTYLIASPSIWFGNRHVFQGNYFGRLTPKLETTGATARVLVTVGELEQPKQSTKPTPPSGITARPGLADRTQVDDSKELVKRLQNTPGLHTELIVFERENHGSVVPAAISRGISFALDTEAKQPPPAPKRALPKLNTPIPVPTADEYVALTPRERYDMRTALRSWPKDISGPWVTQFKYIMDAALWYDDHYALHAEKVLMDEQNGTAADAH